MAAMKESPRFTRVTSEWTSADRWGAVRCRLGMIRTPYTVEPGLYSLGRPCPDSPVLATANYKLSFDIVRKDLGGCDCWILVLDTGGVNVHGGMETGKFGTDELITRIQKARLREVVSHRRLILPQLGAPGVSGEEVRGYTGFDILSGPVRAADIPAYLARGSSTTPHMRAVRFALRDRLALSPAELGRSLVSFSVFAFGALIVAGLGPDGVSLGRAWAGVWPIFALGLGSVCAGSFLVPVFLPLIPLPTFSAKGWVMGALVTASLLHGAGLASGMEPFLVAACYLFFPAASAALALRFAGATPSACFPGARSEIRHSCPFFAAAAFLTAAALALSKLTQWGVL